MMLLYFPRMAKSPTRNSKMLCAKHALERNTLIFHRFVKHFTILVNKSITQNVFRCLFTGYESIY